MNEALFKKFFPDEYVKRFLQADLRSDGRSFDEYRKTEIFTSVNKTSFGSSIVKIGSTIVMCFIEGALTKKSLESVKSSAKLPEKDQYFDVEVTLDKNEEYETSRREKMIRENYLSTWLLKIIKRIVPDLKEELIVPNSHYYWKLVANVKVMSFQGNMIDSSFYSIMAALMTLRIPQINAETIKEKALEYEILSYKRLNLTDKDLYIPFTFKILDSQYILLDPNHEEEDLSDAVFTVIVQAGTSQFLLYKHNGQLVHPETIKAKVSLCKKLAEDMGFQFSNLLKDNVTTCHLN